MQEILKKLDQRIKHWRGLAASTIDPAKSVIYDTKADEAEKIRDMIQAEINKPVPN